MTKPTPSLSRVRSSASHQSSEASELSTRKRHSRKDEVIRKKSEQELSRKKQGGSRLRQKSKQVAGTVSALKPLLALTVNEGMPVVEAAQLMAAKRSDCVLVVDDEDRLSGIFTAKDLAYRVVAESLDARSTPVAQIMTKNPMCVTSDTSATDALNLMVSRGFRHLPVCNEEGDIFGLLDITKCLYEALDKMERAYGSSRKLYDALEGMEREWNTSPVQLFGYMETLRERMSCPDLSTVLDGSQPAEVNVKTNVRDVARMMKGYHTTAVLVSDRHGLAGIFTTKDIALRVIARGINPDNCSVVRVMTPNPDTATPQTTIFEALQRMNDGHYLNLPVLEGDSVVGMVDVLRLTYATLEQIHSMQGSDGEGPMWSQFWDSFGAGETESQSSEPTNGSYPTFGSHPSHSINGPNNSLRSAPVSASPSAQGEITPNDSASMVANKYANGNHNDAHSSVSSAHGSRESDQFAFKFSSSSGKTHRFMSAQNSYVRLHDTVCQKIKDEHLRLSNPQEDTSMNLTIYYVDDENDEVLITSDADIIEAVALAKRVGQNRVLLRVYNDAAPSKIVEPTNPTTKTHRRANRRRKNVDYQSYLLPAAVVFLGAVIVGVIYFSKPKGRYT